MKTRTKVQFLAVAWTMMIAIPVTVLALSATAYVTENLIQISNAITHFGQQLAKFGTDWLFASEVVGLIAGQIIILAVVAITVYSVRKENKQPE
jgi:hypothetical protein